ncbi:CDP-glucose 4,6-dehydratase [hydrothermal vent metagenome]|uniref:CDP-glucose 4,6-dehydratase n=1 Tax=hydrothermal vent metagenome TaxID=652676 RepID=A0A3B1CAR0_9ZZZZ
MKLEHTFWNNRSVFLTGHTGFKGAWLSLILQRLGAKVTGYALDFPAGKPLFTGAQIASGMNSVIGDILNQKQMGSVLAEAKPEIVIHMAAQSLVRESYRNPIESFHTNVMGTANLLESVRNAKGVRAVIVVTSDKCYENRHWEWGYRENDPLGASDPYSASKGCAELVTASYRSSFFNPESYNKHGVAIASARAGNVFGGGDFGKDRLIADCIQAFANKEPVRLRNPASTRPWQFVLNLLGGYLMLAEKLHRDGPAYGEGWNFGPEGDPITVQNVANQMASLFGGGATVEVDHGNHPHEAQALGLDSAKARLKLGWRPTIDFQSALEQTVAWYTSYIACKDVRKISIEQIETTLFE